MQLLRRLCTCCRGHVHRVVAVPFFQLAGLASAAHRDAELFAHCQCLGGCACSPAFSWQTPFLHSSCVFSIHFDCMSVQIAAVLAAAADT